MVTSTNSLSLDLEWPADPSATNPEELFAAGYSACFNGALQLMLQNADVEHKGTSVQVECDLGKVEGGAAAIPCPAPPPFPAPCRRRAPSAQP